MSQLTPGSPGVMMGFMSQSDPLDDLARVARAIRFRGAASAYLSRVNGAVGTANCIYTKRALFKLGKVDSGVYGIVAGYVNANNYAYISVSNGTVAVAFFVAGVSYGLNSVAALRDPTAFYDLCVGVDTTQAVASDRITVELNGKVLAMTGTYPPQNTSSVFDYTGSTVLIGATTFSGTPQSFYDGPQAFHTNVLGQKLSAASFGQFHPLTRQWRPKDRAVVKALADGGGASSYFLPFDDTTSLSTLCADASAKGNNFTATNIGLTAGGTYDSLTDTPTTNYCTLNPLMPGISSVGTLSNGALTFSYGPSDVTGQQMATFSFQTFKAYYEANPASLSVGNSGNNVHAFGFRALSNSTTRVEYGYMSDGATMRHSLRYLLGGSQVSRVNIDTVAPASTDTLAIAFDSESGIATAYKNGVQVAQITGISTAITDWTPHLARDGTGNGGTWHFNFGQRPFANSPPSGFKALSAKNLPRPSGAALKPWEHFDSLLYTGTGAARDVTGTAFSPDYVMGKDRSAARDFFNYSRPRGVTKYLAANLGSAEQTLANGLTAFLSNGFTAGSDANSNGNAESFVAWLMKAGGAPVANNVGSVASQVSANAPAGISVVTWAGSGAGSATIGHGLGAVPKFILIKNRLGVGTAEWLLGHDALGWGDYILLNSQGARVTATNRWNNTAPTSSVFTVGPLPNAAGETYEALCIAEVPGFSKVFSYTGGGSADGPHVNLGFLPAFTYLKNATSVVDGYIHDAKRAPYNGVMPEVYTAANSVEGSGSGRELDYVSNGLKVRNSNIGHNASGSLYVGLSFAAVPARYANAR